MFDELLLQTPEDPWAIARRAATSVALRAAWQRERSSHSFDRAALRERYGAFVSELRRALDCCPNDTWIRCQLIEALRCSQRLGECVDECDALIARRPQFAWGYRRRAWARRHRFEIEAALMDTEASLALEPDANTRGYRAFLNGLLGNQVECQQEFERVMADDAMLVDAFGLERALFWLMTDDHARALPWLRRRYTRRDDYIRLYLLSVAVTQTHGPIAARPPITAARVAATRLLTTEARHLGEYLLAALALLQGDRDASTALDRCARQDTMLLELSIMDPLVRRSFAPGRLQDLLAETFRTSQGIPTFLARWVNS